MSLNIQTSTGLLEISTKVTKEKVISALGYEPADKKVETTVDTHTKDADIHITSDERELWTENVEDLDSHKSDKTIHVTSAEKQAWNNKSDFSGAYADLIDAPSITETEPGNMVIADESGNIIMQVDKDGLETTMVTAKTAVVNGVDITSKLDEHKEGIETLIAHTTNSTVHITDDERMSWNNKSDFSGDYADLTNAPDIVEDNSGEVVYADEDGNIIVRIGESGLETTQVISDTIVAGGVNVGSVLSTHTGDTNIHITSAERASWNAKADKTYVDETVANLVNSAPEALNTLDELAAALGDDANFATTVTNQIASKVDQTEFDNHTHTKADIGLGNVDNTSDINKPVSTAQQTALDNLKSELSESIVSEAEEWTIVDEDGNIIARVDENGLETTAVTANSVIVNGADVGTTLAGKADKTHTHEEYLEASDITNLATTEYVDAQLDTKADVTHTHSQYLEAADIADKADKSELHSHENKDILDSIDADDIDSWNNKSEFSGDYNDLINAPDIKEDGTGDLVIADNDGNIIFRSNGSGFETTTVTAQNVIVNGIDVETVLNYKAASNHTHDQYLEASDIVGKADKTYVEEELAKMVAEAKADSSNKDAVVLFEAQKSIDAHANNTDIHVTSEERTSWNNKSDADHIQLISNGGTGATTAEQALANLGALPASLLGVAGGVATLDENGAIVGGVKIAVGSYGGTGMAAVGLTFDFEPKVLVIQNSKAETYPVNRYSDNGVIGGDKGITFIKGCTAYPIRAAYDRVGGGTGAVTDKDITVEFNGNGVEWSAPDTWVSNYTEFTIDPASLFNKPGVIYHYFAIGCDDSGSSDSGNTENAISFSMFTSAYGNGAFIAEDGMTWEDWVGSDYNTVGLIVSGGYVYEGQVTDAYKVMDYGNEYAAVLSTDVIEPNGSYGLT